MKLGKFLFIIILFVALPLLYFWVDAWFISEPPLAEYDLNIDKDGINDLLDSFEEITSLEIKDTTGEFPDDFAIYFQMRDSEEMVYHMSLKYEEWLFYSDCQLVLTAIFDHGKGRGGYRMDKNEYMPEMMRRFEKKFLPSIQEFQ